MSASDYPVEFGYLAQDGYYYGPSGIVGLHHRGNDRSTPTGTPIIINGVNIGNTGATGLVGGPHLHTQAGTDVACQNTIDPSPLDFKPGTVVAVGRGTQWGNYITIQVGDKYITYAHLSWINVVVGQVINKEKDMPNEGDVINVYKLVNDKQPDSNEIQVYISKPWSAEDGLYYGKLKVDIENLQTALKKALSSPGADSEKIKKIQEIVNG